MNSFDVWLIQGLTVQNCANGDFFYLYPIYSLQVETLEAYKILIFRFTSLKFGSFNLKLYVDFFIGLNLENPITQECVDPYSPFFFETPCTWSDNGCQGTIVNRTLHGWSLKITLKYPLMQEDTKLLVGNERYEGFIPDMVHILSTILQFNYTLR